MPSVSPRNFTGESSSICWTGNFCVACFVSFLHTSQNRWCFRLILMPSLSRPHYQRRDIPLRHRTEGNRKPLHPSILRLKRILTQTFLNVNFRSLTERFIGPGNYTIPVSFIVVEYRYPSLWAYFNVNFSQRKFPFTQCLLLVMSTGILRFKRILTEMFLSVNFRSPSVFGCWWWVQVAFA